MFNILLDPLPDEWHGHKIDTDFQTGIQIAQCMADEELSVKERFFAARKLLFLDDCPADYKELIESIQWFLNGWNDKITPSRSGKSSKSAKKKEIPSMDFDVDQWRIYAAFLAQYNIDLNREQMHFWVFMGLLANLEECVFTNVVKIREKKIDSKMSKEEKNQLMEAKEAFKIQKAEEDYETKAEQEERQAAIDEFNRLRGK